MELRPYAAPSFLTPQGAWAKRRQLERKGFPTKLRGWRFVTLTVNRDDFGSGLEAFEAGRRHLRQFIYELRDKYEIERWCWKLEFHAPDEQGEIYPHWHLLIDHKARIDKDDIRERWRLGRTNIKAIAGESLDYIFKYAVKAVDQLPEWLLSMRTVRFFQTSPGFFPEKSSADSERDKRLKPSPRQSPEGPEGETKIGRSDTIGERIQKWSQLVVSRTINEAGEVRHALYRNFEESWGAFLGALALVKHSCGIPCSDLKIKSNVVTTSCLNSINLRWA